MQCRPSNMNAIIERENGSTRSSKSQSHGRPKLSASDMPSRSPFEKKTKQDPDQITSMRGNFDDTGENKPGPEQLTLKAVTTSQSKMAIAQAGAAANQPEEEKIEPEVPNFYIQNGRNRILIQNLRLKKRVLQTVKKGEIVGVHCRECYENGFGHVHRFFWSDPKGKQLLAIVEKHYAHHHVFAQHRYCSICVVNFDGEYEKKIHEEKHHNNGGRATEEDDDECRQLVSEPWTPEAEDRILELKPRRVKGHYHHVFPVPSSGQWPDEVHESWFAFPRVRYMRDLSGWKFGECCIRGMM